MINLRHVQIALVIGGIAVTVFLAALGAVALFAGCGASPPPEPGFVVTHARDASR